MTEQRIDLSHVKAQKLVIAPVQQIGVTGNAIRGWTEALLRGPLEQSDQVRRAREAEALAESGDHAAAAESFLAVAKALEDREFAPAAASYLRRGAQEMEQAEMRREAFLLFLRLSRSALEEGDLEAVFLARNARRVAPAELAWEADAMIARANWPEQGEGDGEALRRAWEEMRGKDEECEWAAALVELLALNGEQAAALAVAKDVRERVQLSPGDRLSLELDFLDLLDQSDEEVSRTEPIWLELLEWAADPQLPLETTAVVQQRRGVVLARRGDLSGARRSFLAATETWARQPALNDQAAEAYFSAGTAARALGDLSPRSDDARPLALSLRGTATTPTTRTERLMRRGLRDLLSANHPEALRLFGTAYNISRRAGNLSDFVQAAEGLGDVLLAGGRPALALAAYVQAGNIKKTTEVGETLTVDDVLGVVPLDGAPWEKVAAWAAVAGAGRLANDEGAETVATYALAELEREGPHGFPPNASYYAAQALANVICAVPDALLSRSLTALQERLRLRAGDPRRLAEPLILASLTKRSDQSEAVIDAMLDDDIQASVPVGTLEVLLEARPDQRQRLVADARDGDEAALDALAFAFPGLLEDDRLLVEQARRRVRSAIASQPREEEEESGVITVSYGIGTSMAPAGLLARHCSDAEQRELAETFLRILTDPDPKLPIMTRVSTVEGLHNLAPAVPSDLAEAVAEALAARARTADQPSEWDQVGVDDPLARFHINMAPRDALQSASLEALSVFSKHYPQAIKRLVDGLLIAMQSASERLLTAGLRTLAAQPELGLPGLDLKVFLMHPGEAVRHAAIEAISQRQPENAVPAAARLLGDASAQVRLRLVGIASESEGGDGLLRALAEDRDSYVRAMARLRLAEL